MKWKHFPRYWPFVQGIHRSPVNSPHKGQWRGALMLSLICAWINASVNNREAGDLKCHRAHYDVSVMGKATSWGGYDNSEPPNNQNMSWIKSNGMDKISLPCSYSRNHVHGRANDCAKYELSPWNIAAYRVVATLSRHTDREMDGKHLSWKYKKSNG